MANNLSAIMEKILAAGLKTLRERCVMPRLVNASYSADAAKKGDAIDIPIPTAIDTVDVSPSNVPPAPEDTTPQHVRINLDHWRKNKPFHLTDKELNEIASNKHFLPMQISESARGLANFVNRKILEEYKGVYGFHGEPGDTPFGSTPGVSDAVEVRKVLNKQLCPLDMRRGVVNFDAEANMLALPTFHQANRIGSDRTIRKGEIGEAFGIEWYADDAVPVHTAGTITTGLTAKAATPQAAGLTTIVATTAASTGAADLKEGDIINIAGDDQTYVLTADAVQASADSDVDLQVSPSLQEPLSGGEAITVEGDHTVNLVFHRDALAFATRSLQTSGLEIGHQNMMTMQDPHTGLVLRLEVNRQYKQVAWEFDILFGVKLVRPELAARLAG